MKIYQDLIRKMKLKGVSFDQGLTAQEMLEIESMFQFTFPMELKSFLQTAMPISGGFPHWRYALRSDKGKKMIEYKMNWPLESILSNIKNSDFWNKYWGNEPEKQEEKAQMITSLIQAAPTLIPFYLHRYIPAYANQKKIPVFSVYGIDTIHYGNNLTHYLAREFGLAVPEEFYKYLNDLIEIPFWSQMDG